MSLYRLLFTFIPLLLSPSIAVVVILQSPVKFWDTFTPIFIIQFLGVFLGLSVTITTYIFTVVDKIRDRAKDAIVLGKHYLIEQEKIINVLFEELKQDVRGVFFLLVLVIFTVIVEGLFSNIQYTWIVFDYVWNVSSTAKLVQFTSFLLSFFIIYDIITALFQIFCAAGESRIIVQKER